MNLPKPVEEAVENLKKLPGIGPKTSRRLTFHLLGRPKEEVKSLAQALWNLKEKTAVCEICFNVAEKSPCKICSDEKRDPSKICVVEDPSDVSTIENLGEYKGLYHVLQGVISPLDGVEPHDLKIKELIERVKDKGCREVILALNPTTEGESTSLYIKKKLKPLDVKITRIARGLPMGGHLEYADQDTLGEALAGRKEY